MTNKKVEMATLYLSGRQDKVDVRPANGKKFTIEELQQAVGGFFELLVPAVRGTTVYANESGALVPGFAPNEHTRAFANRRVYARNGYGINWRVMGDVIAVRKVAADETAHSGGFPTVAQLRGKTDVRPANDKKFTIEEPAAKKESDVRPRNKAGLSVIAKEVLKKAPKAKTKVGVK